MDKAQMAQSIIIKPPHFQKDVIIPEIYDLQNIKLIQRCKYPQPPKNKVLQLKKQKFAKVIQGIINKPNIITHKSQKMFKKPKRNSQNPEKYHKVVSDLASSMQEAKLIMQMDEHLGEIIANMEENLAHSTEKIQNALSKVGDFLKDKEKQQKMKQVDEYIVNICRNQSKLKLNQRSSKRSISGYIDEMRQMQTSGIGNIGKKRAQTALARKSLGTTEEFFERQSKSRLLTRSTCNLNIKSNLQNHRTTSRNLISMINTYMTEEKIQKKVLNQKLLNMNRQWTQNGQLKKTFINSRNLNITHQTLTLLKQKRIKTASLNRIDKQYFQK